jgi:hypothetical protein
MLSLAVASDPSFARTIGTRNLRLAKHPAPAPLRGAEAHYCADAAQPACFFAAAQRLRPIRPHRSVPVTPLAEGRAQRPFAARQRALPRGIRKGAARIDGRAKAGRHRRTAPASIPAALGTATQSDRSGTWHRLPEKAGALDRCSSKIAKIPSKIGRWRQIVRHDAWSTRSVTLDLRARPCPCSAS